MRIPIRRCPESRPARPKPDLTLEVTFGRGEKPQFDPNSPDPRVRKAYAPLRHGTMSIKWVTTHVATEEDAGMVAYERTDGGHTMLVVLNTSDTQQSETSQAKMGGSDMLTDFAPGQGISPPVMPNRTICAVVTSRPAKRRRISSACWRSWAS